MNVLWICNRPNCDRKNLLCSTPTSIASGAHSIAQHSQAKKGKKWQTKIPHHTFGIFISISNSRFSFPFHSLLPPRLVVCPFRACCSISVSTPVSNCWVFALRATIRTLSISTNKSINKQEVCMLDWCCICVCACCRCCRWCSQFFLLSVDVDFYFRDKKKQAKSVV